MSEPRRDWDDANAEKRHQGCRVCGYYYVELAHLIGRKHDERRGSALYVHPDSVIPLCRDHHRSFDAGNLDLLPYVTVAESMKAVEQAGSIEQARVRLAPSQTAPAAAVR